MKAKYYDPIVNYEKPGNKEKPSIDGFDVSIGF